MRPRKIFIVADATIIVHEHDTSGNPESRCADGRIFVDVTPIDKRCSGDRASVIALLQRTRSASVTIDGRRVAEIGSGLLALVGFKRDDAESRLDRLVERMLNYRMFADAEGRMNLSLRDAGGELLVVPQFTLAADTNSGNRPSFTPAAAPDDGRVLFEALEARIRHTWPDSGFGVFGADMQVELINDGPVTFWIEVD